MPRSFEITPAPPSVGVESAGQGAVSFIVTNLLGRSVQARASVVPEGETRPEWLRLLEHEREIPARGTSRFDVLITGAPRGHYGFHLLVVDAPAPDESYEVGPSVFFDPVLPPVPREEPRPAPPEPPRPPTPQAPPQKPVPNEPSKAAPPPLVLPSRAFSLLALLGKIVGLFGKAVRAIVILCVMVILIVLAVSVLNGGHC